MKSSVGMWMLGKTYTVFFFLSFFPPFFSILMVLYLSKVFFCWFTCSLELDYLLPTEIYRKYISVVLVLYLFLSTPNKHRCKWFSLSFCFNYYCIHLSFWLYRYDQHARYSPEHIDLPATSPSLSAGNEVCVCGVCLLPDSLLPVMGFLSDYAAAIISSHSRLECQLKQPNCGCKFCASVG